MLKCRVSIGEGRQIFSCFSLDIPRNVELLGGVVLSPVMTTASLSLEKAVTAFLEYRFLKRHLEASF